MAGYRPDDEWALTDESGERIDGGWKGILAFFGILIALIVIGELGHIPLSIFVAAGLFIVLPILCIWSVVGGLRNGVMGARAGARTVRYSRAENPIAYWVLIATWGGLGTFLLAMLGMVIHSIR